MKLKNITGILFFISTALCASSENINYNFQLSETEKEWLGRGRRKKSECVNLAQFVSNPLQLGPSSRVL